MKDIKVEPMSKPSNWSSLLFYEKIGLYAQTLNEVHARYTDKLTAKEIVKDKCPDIEIPRVVRILADYTDLRQEDINPNHILKSTHGSKWNNDFKRLSIIRIINKKLKHWNKKYKLSSIERHYSFIEPRFFIEEKIEDRVLGKTGDAIVYMIRCLYGKPISIGVKFHNIKNNYTTEWLEFPGCKSVKWPVTIEKPYDLDRMLSHASHLSSPFEFVRVDFYLSKDKICFSEFTFTPSGGHISFSNNISLERYLGDMWL